MKILYLTLKGKWYDMIASGEKPEEYRDLKPFWVKRLTNGIKEYKSEYCLNGIGYEVDWKVFTHVTFARGGHFHPSLPQMTIPLKNIEIGKGNPSWGAELGKEYFVIKLSIAN